MNDQPSQQVSRRRFLNTAAAGAAVTLATPTILTAKKTDGATIVGSGEYQYEVHHKWPQLPEKFNWQTTHNVAFDSEGLLYVIHEGIDDKSGHPSIFVFDQEGTYVRSFGTEFQGGGHGIEVRNEGGQDFVYVCAYKHQHSFAKLDTAGEIVWRKGAPMESGVYLEGEDKFPGSGKWGRDRFMPTNIAFLDDGGFFLADGYGAFRVHRYDKDANWVSSFGQPTDKEHKGDGYFNLPHGVWIDGRGEEQLVVVADRVMKRLQWFSFDGEHRKTLDGFILPANVDTRGELMLVPDLSSRVTLLDKDNQVIAQLGNGLDDQGNVKAKRDDEATWQNGEFVHPHDACFDREGNIFVAEWVQRGRVTKLRKLS